MLKRIIIFLLMLGTFCGSYAGIDTKIDPLPYSHGKTGIVFPSQLGLFKKQGQSVYSPESSGISVRYMYKDVKMDIYLYDQGIKNIPDGNSDILLQHFKQNIRDIGAIGYYTNLKAESSGTAAFTGKDYNLECLFAKFTFGEVKTGPRPPETSITYILLTGWKQHFLKVRCTFKDDADKSKEKAMNNCLDELEKILGLETLKNKGAVPAAENAFKNN